MGIYLKHKLVIFSLSIWIKIINHFYLRCSKTKSNKQFITFAVSFAFWLVNVWLIWVRNGFITQFEIICCRCFCPSNWFMIDTPLRYFKVEWWWFTVMSSSSQIKRQPYNQFNCNDRSVMINVIVSGWDFGLPLAFGETEKNRQTSFLFSSFKIHENRCRDQIRSMWPIFQFCANYYS